MRYTTFNQVKPGQKIRSGGTNYKVTNVRFLGGGLVEVDVLGDVLRKDSREEVFVYEDDAKDTDPRTTAAASEARDLLASIVGQCWEMQNWSDESLARLVHEIRSIDDRMPSDPLAREG